MYTEVFDNIDILINMAGSSLNIDDINLELIALKKQINNKKNEINDLRSLISDNRYFNASDELVDKNIEISLKNKIVKLNKKLKTIENEIELINSKEKSMHKNIVELRDKLSNNENYLNVLTCKVNNCKNNGYYKELLNKENENVKLLNKELKDKNKEYDNILKELDLNNQARIELTEQLDNETNRLNDILSNLKNPNTYIDEDLKDSDNNKLKELEAELNALEKKELEYLTDAKVIGMDAKDLIANNEITEALNKIKELVTIVKTKPYMDIVNMEIITEELDKKEALRTELSNLIDNKKYNTIDNDAINKRITFIENEIESNNQKIKNYTDEINIIDDFINSNLGEIISNLEKDVNQLESILNEYRRMLKDNNKSLKVKSNIENAIEKKEKEKIILDRLLSSYKENFIEKLSNTNVLNDMIKSLKDENNKYEAEKIGLEKASMIDFKTKDLIEEEKDKEQLRELNEEIRLLKNRTKYDKTVQEIYDQIEMFLEQHKIANKHKTEKTIVNNTDVNNFFDSISSDLKVKDKFKVVEMIPVETIKNQDGGI